MKKNLFKVNFAFVIIALLFLVFTFSGCNSKKENYAFSYSSEGNGYIECTYDVESSVVSGTKIELKFVALGSDTLTNLYVNDKETEISSSLTLTIKENTVVKAVFSGTSYKEQSYNKYSDPVSHGGRPGEQVEEGDKTYCATVLAVYANGYFTTDGTGYKVITTDEPYKFSVGDVLIHVVTKAGNNDFTLSLYKVDKVEIFNENVITDVDNYLLHNDFNCVYIEVTGKVVYENDAYYIDLYNDSYVLYVNSPSEDFELNSLVDKYVTVKGYMDDYYNYEYLNFYMTECQENHDVTEQDDNKETEKVNSPVKAEDQSKLCAFFEEDWTSVKVVINGSQTYDMTEKDGYFTYDYNSTIKKVQFKSGAKMTEVFTIDTDKLVFMCQGVKFNNLYSGYFTSYKDASNSVTKLTTVTINDLHGYITQTGVDVGGISNTAYLIDQIRNENNVDDVILAANGDMFQGTAISNLSYGRSVVEAMNLMDFDFMGIGNHEFDWGIEKIFTYFDGDESNGEANFPLVNSNIVYSSNNELVLLDGYNMYDTITIERNGLKIGVISCIAQLKSSILYTRVCDYEFKNTSSVAIPLATALKKAGADIVIVNIHGGDSSGIENFSENQELVNAKYDGNPLIDLVINGHTHTNQTGYIERDGADLPVLQAACYNACIGEYEIYYDTVENRVVSTNINTYNINYTASTNYEEEVQKVVDYNYSLVEDQINEVYCVGGEDINNKSQLYNWGANVLRAAVGAQVGISNIAGLRSTGNITKNNGIGLENMYLINPFDNEIVLCKVKASTLYSYLSRSGGCYYTMDDNLSLASMQNSDEVITVAVIDYVFYGNFATTIESVNTHVIYRDAMIADLRLRETFNPSTEYTALIGNLYNK